MFREEIEKLVKVLEDDGILKLCELKTNYESSSLGLTIKKDEDVALVLGKLFFLKQNRLINDFMILSVFPKNIQVFARVTL